MEFLWEILGLYIGVPTKQLHPLYAAETREGNDAKPFGKGQTEHVMCLFLFEFSYCACLLGAQQHFLLSSSQWLLFHEIQWFSLPMRQSFLIQPLLIWAIQFNHIRFGSAQWLVHCMPHIIANVSLNYYNIMIIKND